MLSQTCMCSVLLSNSMHKMWLFTISNRIFIIKMWGNSRVILTDRYLRLWSFVPSSQKWIRLSKLSIYFSFKILCFPCFSMAVARCYNNWNLNTSSLRNAWWTGLKTSYDGQPYTHKSQNVRHDSLLRQVVQGKGPSCNWCWNIEQTRHTTK